MEKRLQTVYRWCLPLVNSETRVMMLPWNLSVKPNTKHIKYDLDDFGVCCIISRNYSSGLEHSSYLRRSAEGFA